MLLRTTPISRKFLLRFLRSALTWASAACKSRTFCLMSSASMGVRMVARALPGSGGSAARARASAACLAAWRAAQGAAPRSPSLRLRGEDSSLPAPPLGVTDFPGADAFIEALVTADFFIFAISLSVRGKALEILRLRARCPLAFACLALWGVTRAKSLAPFTRVDRCASIQEIRQPPERVSQTRLQAPDFGLQETWRSRTWSPESGVR